MPCLPYVLAKKSTYVLAPFPEGKTPSAKSTQGTRLPGYRALRHFYSFMVQIPNSRSGYQFLLSAVRVCLPDSDRMLGSRWIGSRRMLVMSSCRVGKHRRSCLRGSHYPLVAL